MNSSDSIGPAPQHLYRPRLFNQRFPHLRPRRPFGPDLVRSVASRDDPHEAVIGSVKRGIADRLAGLVEGSEGFG
jgi:hypothetical protein